MNKITVWGSRKVNIGDYEGRDFGISFTREQINNIENKAVITETASMDIPDDANFEQVAHEMLDKIDKVLDKREDEIRLATDDFVTEFNTLEKLHNKGIGRQLKKTRTRKISVGNHIFDEVEEEIKEKRNRKRRRK